MNAGFLHLVESMLLKSLSSKKVLISIFLLIGVVITAFSAALYFHIPLTLNLSRFIGLRPTIELSLTNNNPGVTVGISKNNVDAIISTLPLLSDKISAVAITITDQKQLFSKSWGKGSVFAGYSAKIDENGVVGLTFFLDPRLVKNANWSAESVGKQITNMLVESLLYLELNFNNPSFGDGATSDATYQQYLQQQINEKSLVLIEQLQSQEKNTVFWVEYAQ